MMLSLDEIKKRAFDIILNREMQKVDAKLFQLEQGLFPPTYDDPLGQGPKEFRETIQAAREQTRLSLKSRIETEMDNKLLRFLIAEEEEKVDAKQPGL